MRYKSIEEEKIPKIGSVASGPNNNQFYTSISSFDFSNFLIEHVCFKAYFSAKFHLLTLIFLSSWLNFLKSFFLDFHCFFVNHSKP